jgi:hypothetical protein
MEEHDILFVKANYLLGAKVHHGRAVVNLYNVTSLSKIIIEREYELPPHWANAELAFAPNVSLTGDAPSPPHALFYADPDVRVLLLSAKQVNGSKEWLIINESYFRPTSRPDQQLVLWANWSRYCLMKTLPAYPVTHNAQIIGNRIVFLESEAASGGRVRQQRLRLIEFPAYPDPRNDSRGTNWIHIGQRSVLIPNETIKDISSYSALGAGVDSISATEDNIVLFLVSIRPFNHNTYHKLIFYCRNHIGMPKVST